MEVNNYDPPNSLDKLPSYLLNDPIHRWRAETGIELIHEEPSYEEFKRICSNWDLMSKSQKMVSDSKSIELFGIKNKEHQKLLENKMLLKIREYKSMNKAEYIFTKIAVTADQLLASDQQVLQEGLDKYKTVSAKKGANIDKEMSDYYKRQALYDSVWQDAYKTLSSKEKKKYDSKWEKDVHSKAMELDKTDVNRNRMKIWQDTNQALDPELRQDWLNKKSKKYISQLYKDRDLVSNEFNTAWGLNKSAQEETAPPKKKSLWQKLKGTPEQQKIVNNSMMTMGIMG